MALPDPARKLTYEDLLLFPEDDLLRHEILDGEHYVTASPFRRHQRVSGNLHLLLAPFVRDRRLGEVYYAPVDVILSLHDIAVPDLIFVSNERLEILAEKNVQGAPDLVIEILSKSTSHRDKGIKLERYGRFGVQEYWLVDPDHRTLRLYRRDGERLAVAADLSADSGDSLSTPLLPGLVIPLRKVFE
ncbi:MAG TPA: Uma2 family endonuclease [Thermoanaerobaculia bacterium]